MAYNYYANPYMYQQGYQAPQQQQLQIQNGGFVSVRSEQEARSYPVAPGNSVTFKNEVAPYIYTKTMGFSQLDLPIFEKYRLIKEEMPEETAAPPIDDSAQKKIEDEITRLWTEINSLKEMRRPPKKEIVKNDQSV